jgi:hypothetical protein
MADLIIKREVARRDLLRRYAVEVDGARVGYVRAGGTIHVKIAEGMRKICLSIDGFSSQDITVLASDQCAAILHCRPNDDPSVEMRAYGWPLRDAVKLPLDSASYIALQIEEASTLARSFLKAAWSVARFQIQERSKPGQRSRYGLTAGDLSVLYHGCRVAQANMVTTIGSANDQLWRELINVGWLTEGTIPAVNSGSAIGYRFTDAGRLELIEIFEG